MAFVCHILSALESDNIAIRIMPYLSTHLTRYYLHAIYLRRLFTGRLKGLGLPKISIYLEQMRGAKAII